MVCGDGTPIIGCEPAARIRQQYGEDNLLAYATDANSDFEWGMINGKFSALRWVLGDEWDFLDT